MKISSKISLLLAGVIVFAGTPNYATAQEEKGGKGEVTERQEAEPGTVTKTTEAEAGGQKGKKKPSSKAGKIGTKNRDVLKAVAQEMNRYTNQQARLKKGRDVAAKKNDEAMKKKVKDLQPKVEEKHKKEMAKLHEKYGEKAVNEALEVLENERKRGKDGKVNRAGTNKKKKQNQRRNQGGSGEGEGEGSGETNS